MLEVDKISSSILEHFILLQILFNTDKYLAILAAQMGPWLYVLVFAIVFAETGLVVTPFLPGDSLLFALGSLTALPQSNITILHLSIILIIATFCGDNVNYFIGRRIGPKIFQSKTSKIFNHEYLIRTQEFYNKYGKRAVIMARFVPIVRTFVPFIAGVGKMNYRLYLAFSLLGSILWTQSFLWAGNVFGGLEAIKHHFQLVIIIVIVISILPGLIAWYRNRKSSKV